MLLLHGAVEGLVVRPGRLEHELELHPPMIGQPERVSRPSRDGGPGAAPPGGATVGGVVRKMVFSDATGLWR